MIDRKYIFFTFPFLVALIGAYSYSLSQRSMVHHEDNPGRQVYISEGCIHCHSQYSRPTGRDKEMWAPADQPPGQDASAVLIGNRRQGPDLSNIGLRRSREWNQMHLIHPDQINPGSRMPSYRHLFAKGNDEAGEDLLDYLSSLTTEQVDAWQNQVYSWAPQGDPSAGDPQDGQVTYLRNCVQCHGPNGLGDGLAGRFFSNPPRNLASDRFLYAPDTLDQQARHIRLAQIIKFGITGTSMPGHEYLNDQEIIDLLAYLSILRKNLSENADIDR